MRLFVALIALLLQIVTAPFAGPTKKSNVLGDTSGPYPTTVVVQPTIQIITPTSAVLPTSNPTVVPTTYQPTVVPTQAAASANTQSSVDWWAFLLPFLNSTKTTNVTTPTTSTSTTGQQASGTTGVVLKTSHSVSTPIVDSYSQKVQDYLIGYSNTQQKNQSLVAKQVSSITQDPQKQVIVTQVNQSLADVNKQYAVKVNVYLNVMGETLQSVAASDPSLTTGTTANAKAYQAALSAVEKAAAIAASNLGQSTVTLSGDPAKLKTDVEKSVNDSKKNILLTQQQVSTAADAVLKVVANTGISQ